MDGKAGMPEPQRFHIGLIDLFAILLPGALLVYALKGDVEPWLASQGYPPPTGTVERWAAFLFASYLVGHFIFLIGSWALDGIDGRIRKAGYESWKRKVACERPPSKHPEIENWAGTGGWLKRLLDDLWSKTSFPERLSRRFFDEEDWAALDAVSRLKFDALTEEGPATMSKRASAINSFQWSKARLALGHPEALAIVQRHEADSKFFRSLCVVLPLLGGWWLLHCRWELGVAAFLLLLPAAWRFVHLRAASTSHAYWLVLTLETSPPPAGAAGKAGSSSAATVSSIEPPPSTREPS